MRYPSIKYHLQPYKILARRKTTINHAFASAVAPNDEYDDARIRSAIARLGQDPDSDLKCVYCDDQAETWDHVFGTVRNSQFSGHGHRLGNLLPSCKSCNSRKGNKEWEVFVRNNGLTSKQSESEIQQRIDLIGAYISEFSYSDCLRQDSRELTRLNEIRETIFRLFEEADELAKAIRENFIRPR